MIVCPDCREALTVPTSPCPFCTWMPYEREGCLDYLSRRDRESHEIQQYVQTYNVLAERNITQPIESDAYVEGLAATLVDRLGDIGGQRICDVGSGRGYLIKHMLLKGASEVTAVDIADVSLGVVAKKFGVRAFLANAENLPFVKEFDVITATDILEHVLNTSNFLVTANWALREGGRLAVRVPYLEAMLPYSNFHGLPMHYTHLRTFDRRVLKHMIEECGFRVQSIFYDGFNPDYMHGFWKKWSWLHDTLRTRVVARLEHVVSRGNPIIARALMKPIEICAIARKFVHVEPRNYHRSLAEFYGRRVLKEKDGGHMNDADPRRYKARHKADEVKPVDSGADWRK